MRLRREVPQRRACEAHEDAGRAVFTISVLGISALFWLVEIGQACGWWQ